ncbi:MAG: short-chain dehydrogenase [Crocinitomicaceae bacterium]|nr:short-chain dehydrogenase [Crocinitomicaceae bacterium]|tara:strand:+ start:7532 stop:8251 length:720 start_codon:yes stop_codon:yes gene_type:complete
MNIYYITGTSRGLGLAFAEEILKDENNLVIGIGRQCEIEHANYSHKRLDLADTVEVAKFRFGQHQKADKVVLINNAGTLGEIKYVGGLDNKELVNALHINLVSPCVLMNNFLTAYRNEQNLEKVILNISSGAAVNPYDGWSAYCTSKAGLNMFSEVISSEKEIAKIRGLKIFSIAPGVIETAMQDQIRTADKKDFNQVDRFVELKNEGGLQSPTETAVRLLAMIENSRSNEVYQDLRNA